MTPPEQIGPEGEAWDDGWQAFEDGKPRTAVPAKLSKLFRAAWETAGYPEDF